MTNPVQIEIEIQIPMRVEIDVDIEKVDKHTPPHSGGDSIA